MEQEKLLSLAWRIVERLETKGYQAYLVGGFVRDRLLGRPIKDIDIATSAVPQSVLALFERAEPTGLQHGTVTVIAEGVPFEVTTFRSESGYSDNRRPDEVRFIDDIREDLSRRDFTMNAMALSRELNLLDPFGGKRDLEDGLLRCVGDPALRFAEDALRMLRCVRFAAEYGLEVEAGTWQALIRHAGSIRNIAAERIRAELERIVEGCHPERGLQLLAECGLPRHFKVSFVIDPDRLVVPAATDILQRCRQTDNPVIRWALLFMAGEIGPEKAAASMRKWTFPNRKSQAIAGLLALHEQLANETEVAGIERFWKHYALRYGIETAKLWLKLMDAAGQSAAKLLPNSHIRRLLLSEGSRWLSTMPVAEMSDLAIRGQELLEAGIRKGPEIGSLLRQLLEKAALGDIANDKKTLLAEAMKLSADKE